MIEDIDKRLFNRIEEKRTEFEQQNINFWHPFEDSSSEKQKHFELLLRADLPAVFYGGFK